MEAALQLASEWALCLVSIMKEEKLSQTTIKIAGGNRTLADTTAFRRMT
jgi:hypothetical protein